MPAQRSVGAPVPRPSAGNDRHPARGRLGGRVVDTHGEPIEEAQVIIASGPSHVDIASLTGRDGKFAFGPLVPGRYLLRVAAQGCDPSTEDVTVMADMQADMTVTLRPGSQEPMPEPSRPARPHRRPAGRRWEAPEVPGDDQDGWENQDGWDK